jgi:hypothetical protein
MRSDQIHLTHAFHIPFTGRPTQESGLTSCELVQRNFKDRGPLSAGALQMTRHERKELEEKLAEAHKLALEPADALTRERLAQLIEDLEYELLVGLLAA